MEVEVGRILGTEEESIIADKVGTQIVENEQVGSKEDVNVIVKVNKPNNLSFKIQLFFRKVLRSHPTKVKVCQTMQMKKLKNKMLKKKKVQCLKN